MTTYNTNTDAANASGANELSANPANIFRQLESEQIQESEQELQQQEEEESFKVVSSRARANEPSICIPRVFKSTTRRDLFNIIEKLNIGAVDRIDMVPKTNERGECHYKVFIHFKQWHKNPMAQATRDKLLAGEEIKIVYNAPWFWKCTASRVEKPEFRDYTAPPPRIDLGGSKSLSKQDAKQDAKQDVMEE